MTNMSHDSTSDQPVPAVVQTIRVTDRRVLVAFVIFMLVFGLLGWRVQINQDEIRRNQIQQTQIFQTLIHNQAVYNWDQCQRSVTNTIKINAKDEALIRLLIKFAKPSPAVSQWISDTRKAHLTVPDCGIHP
jgi:hypothetical protein